MNRVDEEFIFRRATNWSEMAPPNIVREPGCQTDRTKQIHRCRVIDEASSATEEIWRCKCGFEIPAKHCFKIDLNIVELTG